MYSKFFSMKPNRLLLGACFLFLIGIMVASSDHATAARADIWGGVVVPSDATVTINGVSVKAEQGKFKLQVPKERNRRYVIEIERIGYVSYQSIHVGSALQSLTVGLQEAQRIVFDPTLPLTAKGKNGGALELAANSLVDARGNRPKGKVTLFWHDYDVTREAIPGDQTGINSNGKMVSLNTVGAISAEFVASSRIDMVDCTPSHNPFTTGIPIQPCDNTPSAKPRLTYNLAKGKEATISMPAPRVKSTVRMWSYDTAKGVWIEDAQPAKFDGRRYTAKVSHFSTWNFDWEKQDPACIQLNVNESELPVTITAIMLTDPNQTRTLEVTDITNALYNLEPFTDVEFYWGSPPTGAPFAVINSGAPWGGTGIPPFPYDDCNGVLDIEPPECGILWDTHHGVIDFGGGAYSPSGLYSDLSNILGIVESSAGVLNVDLEDYCVLVVALGSAWDSEYSSAEVEVISSFVNNGGGLIIMGDNGSLDNFTLNITPVSELFGTEVGIVNSEDTATTFEEHPITVDINQISFMLGGTIDVALPSLTVAFDDIGESVVAVAEVGSGKVVTISDNDMWTNDYLGEVDNQQFALNVFGWVFP